MRGNEWSLILFTLLSQHAVGLFLIIQILNTSFFSKPNDAATRALTAKILLTGSIILILAILASFFHISKPRNAVYAVSHFSHSWLSREIVFLLLFAFLAGLSFVLQRTAGASYPFHRGVTILTSVIGLLTIISMAKVYMLETVPVWNSFYTPAQFITASLTLGGAGVIFLSVLPGSGVHPGSLFDGVTNRLLAALLCLISINLLAYLIYLFTLPGAGIAGAESFKLLTGSYLALLVVRLSLMLLSITLTAILLFTGSSSSAHYLLAGLWAVVFVSECIGRYLFYASYARMGM